MVIKPVVEDYLIFGHQFFFMKKVEPWVSNWWHPIVDGDLPLGAFFQPPLKRNIFFGTIYKSGSCYWKKLYQHRKEWSYNLNYLFISLHFSHCKKLLLFPSYFHFFHFSSFLRALIVAQLSPHQYFHSGHFYLLCINCGTIINAPCRYTGWYSNSSIGKLK